MSITFHYRCLMVPPLPPPEGMFPDLPEERFHLSPPDDYALLPVPPIPFNPHEPSPVGPETSPLLGLDDLTQIEFRGRMFLAPMMVITAEDEAVRIRVECNNIDSSWCEMRLTGEQLAELLAIVHNRRDGLDRVINEILKTIGKRFDK